MARFGTLKSNPDFNHAFHKCLMGCNSEVEFEDCWKNMVNTYKLQENKDFNKWLDRLYNIRHK